MGGNPNQALQTIKRQRYATPEKGCLKPKADINQNSSDALPNQYIHLLLFLTIVILATFAIPAKLPRQMRPRRQPQLEGKRISNVIIREKREKPSTHQNEEIENRRTGELKEFATSILRY